MAERRYNWNAYHEIIPQGITNTEGVLIPLDESILYTLMSKDFSDSYDVANFIMTIVRSRDQGNYPWSGGLVPPRDILFYKMRFKFEPNDSETRIIYRDIEYSEITIDPIVYGVTQILYMMHTAEELKYKYDDLDDLEVKLQENFGYQYDRMLRGID